MAPLIYCHCTNCNCTATVLLRQDIRNHQVEEDGFMMDGRQGEQHGRQDDQTSMDRTGSGKIEGTNLVVESVLVLVCLSVLMIGRYFMFLVLTTYCYTALLRVIITIQTTISQGRVAKWNTSKMVGGIQFGISCQVKRAEPKGKAKGENFTETVAVLFRNEKKTVGHREARNFLPSKDQGWRGVRKAASMGHIF